MKIIDADKLHYKTVRIATQKGTKPALVVFAKEIQKMPEIVKHGRWIDMGDFEQCSVCYGTRLKEVQSCYGKMIWLRTPYCPECGAKMDGVGYEYRRKARACHEE